MAEVVHIDQESVVGIEDARCRITFDRQTGRLLGIVNKTIGQEYVTTAPPRQGMPFRLDLDFTEEFSIHPACDSGVTTHGTVTIRPQDCQLVAADPFENGLTLRSRAHELEIRLRVLLKPDTGESDWSLRVTNLRDDPRSVMVSFPYLEGVSLGDGATADQATVLDQAGRVEPAWTFPGGIIGRSSECSMQWHALWNPESRAALGLIFMDPDVFNKIIICNSLEPDVTNPLFPFEPVLFEPGSLELRYFPPVHIPPGASLDLPPIRFLVYEGTWRPAARAYRKWFDQTFRCVEPPQWARASNANVGRWFTKGTTYGEVTHELHTMLNSFRDLPTAHLRIPFDYAEYAFYSRGSMLHGVHTDGDNIVREDMGGAEALRDGIAAVHRLGLHVTLYVEGYIVHNESELAKSGKAAEWAVMNRDGTQPPHYTKQNFSHMCPGAKGWQDHLAATAARLLRETGADGIRLDSLGFHFNPCYNPAHHHATPFGYNEWMKELLAKVRTAALEVNPDALLTTEAPIDWYGQWFHGALTQTYPRDLPPMRLALGSYRPYVYAPAGPVWGSVSGFAGGRNTLGPDMATLEANWLCARFPVHDALVWGDVADHDPEASDAEIVTRRFVGQGYEAIVAVRPECQDPWKWPPATGLSESRRPYALTVRDAAPDDNVFLCDIETLTWRPIEANRQNNALELALDTNWALLVFTPTDGPHLVGFDPLPTLHRGESTTVALYIIAADTRRKTKTRITVAAPGLAGFPRQINVPGKLKIAVPKKALPGHYAIQITGKNILGTKRFLTVE